MVARYVAEVPLTTVSEIFRQAGCSMDLQDMIWDARASTTNARQDMESIEETFHSAFRSEVLASSHLNAQQCVPPAGTSPPFVLNSAGGKMQIVADRAVNVLPVWEWQAKWRWRFGLSDNSCSRLGGPPKDVFSGCFKVF